MLRVLLSIIILFQGICLFGQNSRLYIKAAQQYISNGYFEEALDQYTKAIELDPQNGRAYEERAQVYEQLSRLDEAAADYQRAAVFGSNPAENYLKAAYLFYSLNQKSKALETVTKAISNKSKLYEVYILECKINLDFEKYSEAKVSAENALLLKSTAYALFLRGLAEYGMNDLQQAEIDFEKAIIKDKMLLESYLALAKLQLQTGKTGYAIENCSYVLQNEKTNTEALIIRSKAYSAQKEIHKAIDDISKALVIDSLNTTYLILRGNNYIEYSQYQNAINDFSLALNQELLNPTALEKRAWCYEQTGAKKEAISDYSLLLTIADKSDQKYIDYLTKKNFELKRESDKPLIKLTFPQLTLKHEVPVPSDYVQVELKGTIEDQSIIKTLRINNDTLQNGSKEFGGKDFSIRVDANELEFVTISAIDIYDNISTVSYAIERIETHPPLVRLQNPFVGDDGIISIETDDRYMYIEGSIEDESLISSVFIDEVTASYNPSDMNPRFTATVDISKKNRLRVSAIDVFGNKNEKEYLFRRDGRVLSDDSPMGKTWIILIENSEYKDFVNLSSPVNDMKLMQQALSRYKINKVIVKKNLTKRELERFFSIDLRDLVRVNQVNSLMIWYAGHGQNINETGYWVPSDAIMDQEFSYYNINALKASLYSYTSLTHLLVVSDACSTGSSFNMAMRGPIESIACTQLQLSTKKSSQVFTSAGEGYAYDNSLFTKAFVNTLLNNDNDCASIDDIAKRVSLVMQNNTSQNPEFGRIIGLEDQQGTFFFITK